MLSVLATVWVLGTPFLFIFTVTFGLGVGETEPDNMPLAMVLGVAMYIVGIGIPLAGTLISMLAGKFIQAGLFAIALIVAVLAAWQIRLFPFSFESAVRESMSVMSLCDRMDL